MKIALFSLLIATIACTTFAQGPQKLRKIQNTKATSDSVKKIVDSEYQLYLNKIDSATSALYQKQLERAISVDTAKDTYYGTVFSGIAVIVTILVVFVGFNVYASTRESNRRLRELSAQSQTTLQNQRNAFEEAFRVQTQKFNDLEAKAKEFQDANQKNIDNYLKLIKEKIDSIATNGNTTDKTKIEEIEKDIQRIKEVNIVKNNAGKGEVEYVSVDITGNPFLITCKKCGSTIAFDPPPRLSMAISNAFQSADLTGYKKEPMVKCPNCGTYNHLPIQYTI